MLVEAEEVPSHRLRHVQALDGADLAKGFAANGEVAGFGVARDGFRLRHGAILPETALNRTTWVPAFAGMTAGRGGVERHPHPSHYALRASRDDLPHVGEVKCRR